MKFIGKFIEWLNARVIIKNVILVVSAIIIFFFLVSLLLRVVTRHNRHEVIPDMKGLTVQEVGRRYNKSTVKVEVNDSVYVQGIEGGVILDQLPKPGTDVKPGRRVFVTVSSLGRKIVTIPYVTGYSLRQAKNNLEIAGLEIDKITYRSDIANNYVLEQIYNGKEVEQGDKIEVEQGSAVSLVVGIRVGAPSPLTPKLVGLSLSEAKSRIWETGLNVDKVEFDEDITALTRGDARVYSQTPQQGRRVIPGSKVKIKLTLDDNKISEGNAKSDKEAREISVIQDREILDKQTREREQSDQQGTSEDSIIIRLMEGN